MELDCRRANGQKAERKCGHEGISGVREKVAKKKKYERVMPNSLVRNGD